MTRIRYVPEKDGIPAHWVPAKGEAILGFREFETAQVARDDAEKVGAHFDGRDGVTTFRSEKSLREYMAIERARGRDVRWKEHDERKPRRD